MTRIKAEAYCAFFDEFDRVLDQSNNPKFLSHFKIPFTEIALDSPQNPEDSIRMLPNFWTIIESFMCDTANELSARYNYQVVSNSGKFWVTLTDAWIARKLSGIKQTGPPCFQNHFNSPLQLTLKHHAKHITRKSLNLPKCEEFCIGLNLDCWFRFLYGARCSLIHGDPRSTLLTGVLSLKFRQIIRSHLKKYENRKFERAEDQWGLCMLFLLNYMEASLQPCDRSIGYPTGFKAFSESKHVFLCNHGVQLWYPRMAKLLVKKVFQVICREFPELYLPVEARIVTPKSRIANLIGWSKKHIIHSCGYLFVLQIIILSCVFLMRFILGLWV